MDFLDPVFMKEKMHSELNDLGFANLVCEEMSKQSEEDLKVFPKELIDKVYMFIASMSLRVKEADKKGTLIREFTLAMIKLLSISPETPEFATGANTLLFVGCQFLAVEGSKDPMNVQPTFNKMMTEAALVRSVTKEDYDPDKVAPEVIKQYPANIAELVN